MFAAALRPVTLRAFPRALAQPRLVPAFAAISTRSITYKYTSDHEWSTLDTSKNVATVGITEYAQKALGDVVFVELPEVGTVIALGDECGSIESVKAASEIYAPLSGEIVAINKKLEDQANLINKSPLENGWLFKVQLTNPAEFEDLLTEDGYKSLLED